MVHRQISAYVKRWSLTVGFVAMMFANVTAFLIIGAHYRETTQWQNQYCESLKSGRHELRILVSKLSESTTYEAVKAEMQEFLLSYPEIEC